MHYIIDKMERIRTYSYRNKAIIVSEFGMLNIFNFRQKESPLVGYNDPNFDKVSQL